jgi:hypothetical protein
VTDTQDWRQEPLCVSPGCGRLVRTRGYCETHYRRRLHTGRYGYRDATAAREHVQQLRRLGWPHHQQEGGDEVSVRIHHGTDTSHLITDEVAWWMAMDGDLPAEALRPLDRQALVLILHQRGCTDVEIACHTRMTTYTTGRIRARLGLAPNTSVSEVA